MKSFAFWSVIVVIASVSAAASLDSSSSSLNSNSKHQDVGSELKPIQSSQLHDEYNRYRKSASYGQSFTNQPLTSFSGQPCPKNYLFSCQPSLTPVPCSVQSPSFGSVGAYSAPLPTYVATPQNNYGLQGYGGFIPENFNQFYQY